MKSEKEMTVDILHWFYESDKEKGKAALAQFFSEIDELEMDEITDMATDIRYPRGDD